MTFFQIYQSVGVPVSWDGSATPICILTTGKVLSASSNAHCIQCSVVTTYTAQGQLGAELITAGLHWSLKLMLLQSCLDLLQICMVCLQLPTNLCELDIHLLQSMNPISMHRSNASSSGQTQSDMCSLGVTLETMRAAW